MAQSTARRYQIKRFLINHNLPFRVWVSHSLEVWIGAVLLEDYRPDRKTLEVVTEEDETRRLTVNAERDLRNLTILTGVNDLMYLSYLHEPAVLHNLRVRFCRDRQIYTYCGTVLVAINTYNELPIYNNDMIQKYRSKAMGDLDPHIFAVAEEAYMKLKRELRTLSIIVSGESDTGKTTSVKYIMTSERRLEAASAIPRSRRRSWRAAPSWRCRRVRTPLGQRSCIRGAPSTPSSRSRVSASPRSSSSSSPTRCIYTWTIHM